MSVSTYSNQGDSCTANTGSNDGGRSNLALIVDDDYDNLLFMKYALEALGCPFIAADTGQEALEMAIEYRPSIILLDIFLPDINGFTVLKKLRCCPETYSIPVIAVTAMARDCEKRKLEAEGFSGYLLKPYMIEEIERLLNSFVVYST